ncbi:MAG: hypothetical protein KY469_10220 [Actinobacteria bacterium]|nr:hypothetical protein [Actinomycetota bacterium]
MAALTAVVAVCGACASGDADPTASPSPLTFGPPSFPATAATTPDDPYAIPDTIDAAYIEKVYGALADVFLDAELALADALGAQTVLPPEIRDRLRAIYSPDRFPIIAARWQQYLTDNDPPPIPADPGPVSIHVIEIVEVSRTCLVALAEYDLSRSTASPPTEPVEQYLALVPADPERDPNAFNPTPWEIAYELTVQSGEPNPEAPCER